MSWILHLLPKSLINFFIVSSGHLQEKINVLYRQSCYHQVHQWFSSIRRIKPSIISEKPQQRFSFISLLFAFSTAFFLYSTPVSAGEGKIASGTPNTLDLTVNFMYDEADTDSWKTLFTKTSELLYNATEKQLQLGKITVYVNCPQAVDRSDILILNDNTGARAHLLGLGTSGRHIWISQTHKSTSGAAIGQLGLTHEMGHYVLNLGDEYKGTAVPKAGAPAGTPEKDPDEEFFCSLANGAGKASIMDGGTKVSPNNTRTEFCTDPDDGFTTTHESGYINGENYFTNAQQKKHSESAWETISKIATSKYGVTINEPSSEPQNSITGHSAITWEKVACDSRTVVSIDRSGSMGGSRLSIAKAGGILFVDLARVGDDLGVTSFATSASVDFALQEVIDNTTKQNAKNAINAISSSGSTSIGGGLRTSLNQILTGTRTNIESIVLLSDGNHNSGEDPSDVIPDLITAKVKVYTIAVGSGADVTTLQSIATQTGGSFFSASSDTDLPAIFTLISADLASEGVLKSASEDLPAGNTFTQDVFVDNQVSDLTFIVTWNTGSPTVTLKSPAGRDINPSVAAADPDIEYTAESSHVLYKITGLGLEPGTWDVVVASSAGASTDFVLQALGTSGAIQFSALTDKSQYTYPEPVLLEVSVVAILPVVQATVNASVVRADGSTISNLKMFDDGTNGDVVPNDGVYTIIFNSFAGDGVYTFTLRVDNEAGTAVAVSPDVGEEDPDDVPPIIPPFVREEVVVIQLEGAPDISITTTNLNEAMLDVIYQASLTVINSTPPNTWDIVNGRLPAGLRLHPSTGSIAGTPLVAGISNFRVRVTDSISASYEKDFSITVITEHNFEGGAGAAGVSDEADDQGNLNLEFLDEESDREDACGLLCACLMVRGSNGSSKPPSPGGVLFSLALFLSPVLLVKFKKTRGHIFYVF